MPKEPITPLTVKELQTAALALGDLVALLQRASDDLLEAKQDALYTFRADSLRRCMERATAFYPELYKSLSELNAGTPFTAESVKNPKRRAD